MKSQSLSILDIGRRAYFGILRFDYLLQNEQKRIWRSVAKKRQIILLAAKNLTADGFLLIIRFVKSLVAA